MSVLPPPLPPSLFSLLPSPPSHHECAFSSSPTVSSPYYIVQSLSRVWLFETPWTVAHQAPLSLGLLGQESWSGLPVPSPGDLPDPGIENAYPALQADSSSLSHQGSCMPLSQGYIYIHIPKVCSLRIFWDLISSTLLSPIYIYMVTQMVKNLPAMKETWVWSLGREDPLEKGLETHTSILAYAILWTQEPGGLQSMALQRVGCNWVTNTFCHTHLIMLKFGYYLVLILSAF